MPTQARRDEDKCHCQPNSIYSKSGSPGFRMISEYIGADSVGQLHAMLEALDGRNHHHHVKSHSQTHPFPGVCECDKRSFSSIASYRVKRPPHMPGSLSFLHASAFPRNLAAAAASTSAASSDRPPLGGCPIIDGRHAIARDDLLVAPPRRGHVCNLSSPRRQLLAFDVHRYQYSILSMCTAW